MKVLIEIPDKHRSNIKKKFNSKGTIDGIFDYLKKVEKVSVEIIPDNATNGDVINTLFSDIGIIQTDPYTEIIEIDLDWWNAPYRKD